MKTVKLNELEKKEMNEVRGGQEQQCPGIKCNAVSGSNNWAKKENSLSTAVTFGHGILPVFDGPDAR